MTEDDDTVIEDEDIVDMLYNHPYASSEHEHAYVMLRAAMEIWQMRTTIDELCTRLNEAELALSKITRITNTHRHKDVF